MPMIQLCTHGHYGMAIASALTDNVKTDTVLTSEFQCS